MKLQKEPAETQCVDLVFHAVCARVYAFHPGTVWLRIRLRGPNFDRRVLCRVEGGTDRGEETEGLKEGNGVDKYISKWVARCLPSVSTCCPFLLFLSCNHTQRCKQK